MSDQRIDILDGWRTLAVLLMVPWHFAWDLGLVGLLPASLMGSVPMQLLRCVIAYSFLLLSGISCRYSRGNCRRGLRLCLWAALISLVTWAVGDPVKFGILHLLGVSCLLWAAGERFFTALPPRQGVALSLGLFALGDLLLRDFRVSVPGLWALGFRTAEFYSADYYPLLPWFFLFLAGAYAGGLIRESELPWKDRKLPAALTWPGRHALAIYLIHQPLLYGLAVLLGRAI